MQPTTTYLAILSEKLIEACWIATLILAPLFFNPYSSRMFEPDKVALVRSLAMVMTAAWILRWIEQTGNPAASHFRLSSWRRAPLALPVVFVVITVLIASLLSLQPGLSFFGSYARLQGAYTTISGVVLFALLVACLRERAQLQRTLDAMLLASVPVALYGLVQHFGADAMIWNHGFGVRVFSSLGNPIFLSAFLAMVFFPTVGRLLNGLDRWQERGRGTTDLFPVLAYALLAGLQFAAFAFADSRGPVLAWLFALVLFVFLRLLIFRGSMQAEDGQSNAAPESCIPLSSADLGRATLLALLAILAGAATLFALRRGMFAAGGGRIGLVALACLLPILLVAVWNRNAVRWAWVSLPMLALIAALGLSVLNLAVRSGHVKSSVAMPLAQQVTLLDAKNGSGKARTLIWSGALQLASPHEPIRWPNGHEDPLNALRPLIGYGPETMLLAFPRFYPPDLASLDSRDAMPDRAHNEVFDALVTTGLMGLAAQQCLFIAAFQLTLTLLGFVPGRRAAITSFAAMLVGGVAGAAIFLMIKGPPFLGPGWSSGVAAGVATYLLLFALFHFRVSRGAYTLASLVAVIALAGGVVSIHPGSAPGTLFVTTLVSSAALCVLIYSFGLWVFRETSDRPIVAIEDRMLVAVLLCGLFVHFLETGLTGIPTITTRTYFWAYAGLLVALALRFTPKAVGSLTGEYGPAHAMPVQVDVNSATTPPQPTMQRVDGFRLPPGMGPVLAMALITALAMASLVYAFVNQQTFFTGELHASSLVLVAKALTRSARQDDHQLFGILLVILGTWAAGGGLLLSKLRQNPLTGSRRLCGAFFLYMIASLAALFAYVCAHVLMLREMGHLANRARVMETSGGIPDTQQLLKLTEWASELPVFFCGFVLVVVIAVAISLATPWFSLRGTVSTKPGRWAVVVLLPLLYLGINRSNLDGIRANIVFRQAAALPAVGAWDAKLLHLSRAIELQPSEDHYYAWMADAYLQKAAVAPEPDSLAQPETGDPLAPKRAWLRKLGREDALKGARTALERARELAPLDPDYSANLGRLYSYWAGQGSDSKMRRDHFRLAGEAFRQTTALSPNKAQFWNESASVQLDLGQMDRALGDRARSEAEFAAAQRFLSRSLALDDHYDRSYVVAAELARLQGRADEAAANYRQALEINPTLAEAWQGLVVLHHAHVKAAELEATALRHLGNHPSILPALQLLVAEIYLPSGRLADAIQTQRRVVALSNQPGRAYEQLSLALLLAETGSLAESLSIAQSSLAGLPPERQDEARALIASLRKGLSAGEHH